MPVPWVKNPNALIFGASICIATAGRVALNDVSVPTSEASIRMHPTIFWLKKAFEVGVENSYLHKKHRSVIVTDV